MAFANKLLHFKGKAGFLAHRKKFLDGTWLAYFAPGQKPYMIGGFNPVDTPGPWPQVRAGTPAVHDGTFTGLVPVPLIPYMPATDWPRAGALLRPIQVAWLEFRAGAVYDLCQDPIVMEHPFDTGTEIISQWQTQPNIVRVEHRRLRPIFDAVKASIEALRPGRTWVTVCDWCDEAGNTSGPYRGHDGAPEVEEWIAKADGRSVAVNESIGRASGSGFVEFPAETGSYLGLDFLDIYCGDSMIHGEYMNGTITSTAADVTNNFHCGGAIDENHLASDLTGFWPALYGGRLKPNVGRFHRYAARLYHPPDSWAYWAKTWATALPGDSCNLPNGGMMLYQESKARFDEAVEIAVRDGIDITHPGESTLLGAASLVSLIARHFGFSPQTGKDL